MPLRQSPSRDALLENFIAERKSGKPKDQSWAVAYDVQRDNGGGDRQKEKRNG